MRIKESLEMLIALILILNICLVGQQRLNEITSSADAEIGVSMDTSKTRNLFIHAGVGLFEYFSLGIGYQISPNFAIAVKHANTWVTGHGGSNFFPPNGSGLGVETKYFINCWIFNNASFNYVYYMYVPNNYDDKYGIKPKGNYFEINFGNESINKNAKGRIQLYWSIGLGASYNKYYEKWLIMPSIKIGIFQNLF